MGDEKVNFVIISGQSGAGKSQAKKVFEDLGYYCVDNLPPSLIPDFVRLLENNAENISHVALVIDIRGGQFFKDLEDHLAIFSERHHDVKIFYFEAGDSVLLKRFKETRRSHPLNPTGRIEEAISEEKQKLSSLRDKAHFIINTSDMNQAKLKSEIARYLKIGEEITGIAITVMSFGFKKGIPMDSDFIFDVRFLPNPYYIDELRHKTGNQKEVSDYVMSFEESVKYYDHLMHLIDYVIPQFSNDGRTQLVISIGCTGGQHRSVTFTNKMAKALIQKGYSVNTVHRDARKEA